VTEPKIDERDLLTTRLRLYESLRQESLQSMSQRNAILALGSGAIGVLFLAGVSAVTAATPSAFIAYIVFTLMLPILAMLLAAMWLGEAARMSRAGQYLCQIEDEVNDLLSRAYSGDLAPDLHHWLYWENWLREHAEPPASRAPALLRYVAVRSAEVIAKLNILSTPRSRQLGYPYVAVGMCFGACALGPVILSLWVAINHFTCLARIVAFSLSGTMALVTIIVFANLFERAMRLP